EAVGAIHTGGLRDADRVTQVVSAREGDGGAGDPRLARLLDAVVIGVVVDEPGQARRLHFPEVVIGAGVVVRQDDPGELVLAGGAARRADRVLAVEVTGRLDLRDRVRPRPQPGEAVRAVRGRLLADRDGVAQVVGAGELHGHPGDGSLPGILGAVLVGIDVHEARQATCLQLAEVVVGPRDVGGQDDVGELVLAGRAAGRPDGVLAVQVAGRFHLGDRVRPRPQACEAVRAVGGGRQRGADRVAAIVGAREL